MMNLKHRIRGAVMVVATFALAGCSSTLDTGYQPRKLGASDEARRGYYAQPFTPEAQAARQDEQNFGDSHHPKPGY